MSAFNNKIIIITQVNPYTPVGGSTVVLKNLFSNIDSNSYCFAYLGRFSRKSDKKFKSYSNLYRLIPNFHPIQIIGYLFPKFKYWYAVRKGVRLVKRLKPNCIIGLYPTIASLDVSVRVAEKTGINYFPYLHDTVLEGLAHSQFSEKAKKTQKKVFKIAHKIITMSEGMSDYYSEKYNIKTFPLEHTYPEKVSKDPNFKRNEKAFWGGEVYSINENSFERIQDALKDLNTVLTVTSLSPLKVKNTSNIQKTFFPKRTEYINAVNCHGILILAINWPDESKVHEAELSTIFPTKTVEYLASGGPILVHCPEHYFLASFFKKHKCGTVVTDRNGDELKKAILKIKDNGEEIKQMQLNALKAMEIFSLDRIQKKLYDTIFTNK
ncbi:MAG: glycosyltransferase involved in cell wall biosynthesis [Urechidicola sp.]|jgi:glycosyltransferase involved in cell wall biosynthesis